MAAATISAAQLVPCQVPGVAEVLKWRVHQVYESRETLRGDELQSRWLVICAMWRTRRAAG